MLHKSSASPLCDWQVKIFIFLTVYLTGSGSALESAGFSRRKAKAGIIVYGLRIKEEDFED